MRSKNEMLREAVEAAETAMWTAVVESVPEARSGDLPVDVASHLYSAIESAVRSWIDENVQIDAREVLRTCLLEQARAGAVSSSEVAEAMTFLDGTM